MGEKHVYVAVTDVDRQVTVSGDLALLGDLLRELDRERKHAKSPPDPAPKQRQRKRERANEAN